MSRLFTQPTFIDFGACALGAGPQLPALHQIRGSRPAALRAEIRGHCPRQPGVYGMIDLHGELIYVGKAKGLRARLLTYFRPRSRDPKAGRIVSQARSIVWEPCADEFAALHRELELIRRWRPRCNVQGKPHGWQHTHICMGRAPAPYAFLARQPPASAAASFGPILAGQRTRAAVRRLNDWFQLRDCPKTQEMHFADHAGLFPLEMTAGCLRHDFQTCSAPCAGGCSQADYTRQVRSARAFLAGEDLTPLLRLQRDMDAAAADQVFERAAALRDKLAALTWLHSQLDRMRQAQAMGTVIYPVAGHDGMWRWYLLHGGRAVAAVVAPQNGTAPTRHSLSDLAALVQERSRAGRPADHIAGVTLLASWFRRHPAERHLLRNGLDRASQSA